MVSGERTGATKSKRPALLRIFKGKKKTSEISLEGQRFVIGRDDGAEIVLDDQRVSCAHAEVVCGPFGRWWIHDLGSTNGTRVGGERIKERMLHHRDRITISGFTLEFRQSPRELLRVRDDAPPTLSADSIQISAVPSSTRATIKPSHLAAITELGASLLATEDAQERLAILTRCFVTEALPADTASTMRVSADGTTSMLCGPFGRHEADTEGAYCSTTVIDAVRASRATVVASNAAAFEGLSKTLTISAMVRPLAVVACPLRATDRYIDILYLELPWGYATPQWQALFELASASYVQARMVWQMRQDLRASARVEHDLEMAHELQSRLLPDCNKVAELDVAVGYEPSHWVGGDYVDVLHVGDGKVLLLIADVCGKGLSAALVSSSVHTMIHALADSVVDVAGLVTRLNQYLSAHLPESSFVTLTAITVDPQGGELNCLNAGHTAAIVASTDGNVRWLQAERNVALGMLSNHAFEVENTRLEKNETLLLFTDGAYESFEPDQPSIEPEEIAELLAQELVKRPNATAEELSEWFSVTLSERRGVLLRSDDTTWLVARHRS